MSAYAEELDFGLLEGVNGGKGLSPDRSPDRVEVEELRIADLGFRNSALRRSEPRRLGRSFGGFVLRTKFNLRLRRGWGLSGFKEGAVEAALADD
jgi:hypothetical protein